MRWQRIIKKTGRYDGSGKALEAPPLSINAPLPNALLKKKPLVPIRRVAWYLFWIASSRGVLLYNIFMTRNDKLLLKILRGTSDANIPFSELCSLLKNLGFDERIRGSHHIFTHAEVEEILNLQPAGTQAKSYQIKQVRNVILRYRLGGSND